MIIDLVTWLGISEPNLRGPGVQGVLNFLGIFLTGTLAATAWLIKQTLVRRSNANDLRHALYAEIKAHWYVLEVWEDKQALLEAMAKEFEKDNTYSPYFSFFPEPDVYASNLDRLHDLANDEIRPVVRYFHQLAIARAFGFDLKSEASKNFQKERR
ncbi:MAG: hypothetical protein AAFO73_01580 [Pseudomonadota bacterium]